MEWVTTGENTYRIAPGARLTRSLLKSSYLKEAVYRLELDPNSPYTDWLPVSPEDRIVRLGTVGQMIDEASARDFDVVAGVNGDFFSYTGVPSGLQICNREIYTSPSRTKVVLAGMPDRSFRLLEGVDMECVLETDNGDTLQVDMLNRPRLLKHEHHAALYNYRFGASTRTPAGGIEAVIRMREGASFAGGKRLTGCVQSIDVRSDTPIGKGMIVLSATGSKAEWLRNYISSGAAVHLSIGFTQDVTLAEQAISGNSTLAAVLLRNGEVESRLLDTSVPIHTDRHPRTIAAIKSGILNLFVIDGRQPGYSDGMTMAESALYLRMLGMEQAINLDGGGSSTCYVRLPGQERSALLNVPSDGFERSVGNGLVFVNKAPREALEQLLLSPPLPALVLAGSRIVLSAAGIDRFDHPIPLRKEELAWELEGGAGKLNGGEFVAEDSVGKCMVTVRSSGICSTGEITVVRDAARLELIPSTAVIEHGGTLELTVRAYDVQGNEILCSPDVFTWSVKGGIGIMESAGAFLASVREGKGEVVAEYRGVQASIQIQVGKPHLLITGFEHLDDLKSSYEATVPGSVTLTKAARPKPVRFGTFSGKLTYDFTGQTGSSRASVHFLDQDGEIGKVIEGRPIRFGLWVYGDGGGHWLRLGIRDAHGHPISLSLTENGGLDWHNWKYVYAEVPPAIAAPITVTHISLVETNDEKKNAGVIYLDQLRAEYVETDEDVTGPVFTGMLPTPGCEVAETAPVIAVTVEDNESGIDPASIRMKVNGSSVQPTYDAGSGRIHWQPNSPLPDGLCQVSVCASDNAGNPSVPEASWIFMVRG